MSNYNFKLLILLILMTILFGLSFIASKNALQGMGVMQLVFARNVMAFVLLTAIFWTRRNQLFIARSDWKHFFLVAGLSPVGYFIFETFGLLYSNPANVSLIIATIPIFTSIFESWHLKERSGFLAILGIVISLVGVYLLVSVEQSSKIAPRPVLGNILTFGASISGGLYTIFCRKLTQKYSPTTITYYQTAVASVFFLPLALFESWKSVTAYINWFIFLNIAYLAIACSIIAYFILNYTLSHLQATRVAIFTNLIPVITILATWLRYHELLTLRQLAGALLILVGIYLNFFRRQDRATAPLPA